MAEGKKDEKGALEKKMDNIAKELRDLKDEVRRHSANWVRYAAIHVGETGSGKKRGEIGSFRIGAMLACGFAALALLAASVFASGDLWVLYKGDSVYGTCYVTNSATGRAKLVVDDQEMGDLTLTNNIVGVNGDTIDNLTDAQWRFTFDDDATNIGNIVIETDAAATNRADDDFVDLVLVRAYPTNSAIKYDFVNIRGIMTDVTSNTIDGAIEVRVAVNGTEDVEIVQIDANGLVMAASYDITTDDITATNSVITDVIAEQIADSGVTIDLVLLKDKDVTAGHVNAQTNMDAGGWITAGNGITSETDIVVLDSAIIGSNLTASVFTGTTVQVLGSMDVDDSLVVDTGLTVTVWTKFGSSTSTLGRVLQEFTTGGLTVESNANITGYSTSAVVGAVGNLNVGDSAIIASNLTATTITGLTYQALGSMDIDDSLVVDTNVTVGGVVTCATVRATTGDFTNLTINSGAAYTLPDTDNGLNIGRMFRAEYNFDVDGGPIATNAFTNTLGTAINLPDNTVLQKVWIEVLTPVTPVTSEVEINLEATDDVYAASTNLSIALDRDGIPDWTAASVVKTSAAKDLSYGFGAAAVTAGNFVVWGVYGVSD